jgi:hypothetical protein
MTHTNYGASQMPEYSTHPAPNADGDPMNAPLAVRSDSELATIPATPMSIIAAAVQQGASIEVMERLFALQERAQANEARAAFNTAFARFKAACPPIRRTNINPQFSKVNRAGVKVPRTFAGLDDIERDVRGPLSANGLSYRWTDTKVENGMMSMTCVVMHEAGHSESSTVPCLPIDSKAGCADLQKSGTAQSYAMRYSIIQALGLTSCDDDMDGNAEPSGDYQRITEEQAIQLGEMLDAAGANVAKFKEAYNVAKIGDIAAADWASVFATVKKKLDAKKGGAA